MNIRPAAGTGAAASANFPKCAIADHPDKNAADRMKAGSRGKRMRGSSASSATSADERTVSQTFGCMETKHPYSAPQQIRLVEESSND